RSQLVALSSSHCRISFMEIAPALYKIRLATFGPLPRTRKMSHRKRSRSASHLCTTTAPARKSFSHKMHKKHKSFLCILCLIVAKNAFRGGGARGSDARYR